MKPDILCFTHLRWNFVYQRPQHLLSRFGRKQRVIYIEEPEFSEREDHYSLQKPELTDVLVATPILNHTADRELYFERMRCVIDTIIKDLVVADHILWYYTPMAMPFTDHLQSLLTVYDCMDELSAFRNAPIRILDYEARLFRKADLIFTGGHSLYEHKRKKHHSIYPFPSSIDGEHFRSARHQREEPEDQAGIPHPRFGFYGVVDERFDTKLLGEIAERKKDWQFVIIGPVAKISSDVLPNSPNIHYLGQKSYDELPGYLAGWDVAIMPFARNESTQFISPTKTPEFLAGGKPVISTSIRDVVFPYGEKELVKIADTVDDFIKAGVAYLGMDQLQRQQWLEKVDAFLSGISWDRTWGQMNRIIERVIHDKKFLNIEKDEAYV